MATLREEEFEPFLKRRLSAFNGLLIHGLDQSAVSLLARRATAALKAEVVQGDLSAFKSAPGNFMDMFMSLSMFGDRQVIALDAADDSFLKFLEPALALNAVANFVLLTADSLSKSSKLRAAVEAAPMFAALAVYEEDEGAARERIRKLIAGEGLRWDLEAEETFYDTVGFDRALITQEAQKLALYCHGQAVISSADVTSICGDIASFDGDELTDAVLSGDLESTDRIFTMLGAEQQRALISFGLHLARLQSLKVELDQGGNLDSVLRNAKPPIFFKRKNAFQAQLRRLSLEDVLGIQETLQAATLQARKNADLAPAILSRTVLSVARMCRSKSA